MTSTSTSTANSTSTSISTATSTDGTCDERFSALRDELDRRLAREGRTALAQACFDFLPARAELDLAGWPEEDIFAHS